MWVRGRTRRGSVGDQPRVAVAAVQVWTRQRMPSSVRFTTRVARRPRASAGRSVRQVSTRRGRRTSARLPPFIGGQWIHPILAGSRSARRTRAGKAQLSGRNARIPLMTASVAYQRLSVRPRPPRRPPPAAAGGRYIPALASVDPDAFGMAIASSTVRSTASARWSDRSPSECVQAVHTGPAGGRARRPGLAGRGPGAVREPVQLTGPAGVRTRHSAQPVHQRRCPRGYRPAAVGHRRRRRGGARVPADRVREPGWTPTPWSPGPRPSRATATLPSPISSPATATCRTRSTR